MQPPPPGAMLLEKYRVERVLGSGGMGVVLEATHVALGQTVAIKLLNPALARTPDVVARFLREARIAATLPSEHVARVSDVGQTETGAPFIVMERLLGHDLEAEFAARGRLPVAEAVHLILEACEGVAEAHARGLVHRDLKPANLFLAERPPRKPVVKVLDFGLSKDVSGGNASLTGTDAVFGTPQYMSPEQIQSTKNVDARSDQHALGMILYEALAGEPPYRAESVTQLIVVIATAPPPRVRVLRPDVPLALEEAIVRALAKRASERFADLGELAAAIAPFGGPEAIAKAELIRRALSNAAVPPNEGPKVATSKVATDEAPTLPLGLPRAPALTNAALTSSVDATKKLRARPKRELLLALAVLTAALLFTAIFIGVQTNQEQHATQAASVEQGTPTQASPSMAEPLPTPTASASSAQASAPASASSKTAKASLTGKPTKTSDKTFKSTMETFGGKRK